MSALMQVGWLTPARRKVIAALLVGGGGAVLLRNFFANKGSGKNAKPRGPKSSKRKYSRGLTKATVMKLVNFAKDRAGQSRLFAILAIAVCFVLLDLRKARLQGELFKTVFMGNTSLFKTLLFQNLGLELTVTVFNKLLANNVSSLGRHWHSRIIEGIHSRYFADIAFYRIKGSNPQDVISGDVPLLTRKMAIASCDMVNATLQFFFYAAQILRHGRASGKFKGMGPMLIMAPIGYAIVAMGIMSRFSPDFAKMQRKERELESSYRQVQSRLQDNAESVALFGGEEYEEKELIDSFGALKKHLTMQIKKSWAFDVVKAYVVKYCQTTFMMIIILAPFFKGKRGSSTAESANVLFEMRYLGDLILHLFYALGQVIRLHNTLQSMGGLFDRVGGLVLEAKELKQERDEQAKSGGGCIKEGDIIEFDDVTIVTPNGNQLCEGLTFDVKANDHLIVCGPNGAGKSSIFRCLGTLWPIPKGTITRPGGNKEGLVADVYYLPQKPYNVVGDLKDQITYPDPPSKNDGLTPARLRGLLRMVELEYLVDMSAEEVMNWEDKLSLGETQRLAMARLFWHKPKYAILDECTSAVSLQMEERLFLTCRRMGITLITISHRPALQEYHNRMLVLDGNGGWSLEHLDQSGQEEYAVVGKTREEALEIIMSELESSGNIKAHTKAGASLVSKDKMQLGEDLWQRLYHLNSLMFSSRSEEAYSLGSLAALVVVRTWLSNSIAHMNGEALQLMLKQDANGFVRLIVFALSLGMGQALLGPTLEHLEKHMSLLWRTRLTNYIIGRYMKNQAFFKLKETMPDMAVVGQIDQILAEDVLQLTEGVANMWHDFVKPVVDICWFARAMWSLTGVEGLKYQFLFMVGGTFFLKVVRPNLAELTAKREKLDGQFRFVHSRLRTHSEAVAFFNGGAAEHRIIDKHFKAKIAHQRICKRKEHVYAVAQQFVSYFLPQNVVWAMSMLYQQQYTVDKDVATLSMQQQGALSHDLRLLGAVVNHSFSAFGNIMNLPGKAESLIGHVHRVSKLIESLDKVEAMTSKATVFGDVGEVTFESGGNVIEYKEADIFTPNHSQTLAKGMSFKLTRGEDVGLLITGPNGSGKTSVFRILCNLWPMKNGSVRAPQPKADVLFIPTRPYMPRGTLADQITYPERMVHPLSQETKDTLIDIMEKVKLRYLWEREGFDSYNDSYENVLSLGEQQRLNVARVFWHKPRFVCLDECTSAVALDGEEEIYQHLAKMGCTTLTASQKPWLTNFHSHILHLAADGLGGWSFQAIDESMQFKGKTRLAGNAYVDKRQLP